MINLKVSDLFKVNFFPDFRLLAGQGGLESEICKVFILDSPDLVQWMRGGELVIGNGYVFHNNFEEFPKFLRKLSEINAAALGMKFERFRFTDNYQEMLDLANELNFPLIEVPFKYTWSMIYEEIYRSTHIVPEGAPTGTSDILTAIEERMDPLDIAYSLHAKVGRKLYVYSQKLQIAHYIDSDDYAAAGDPDADFRRGTIIHRSNQHNIGSIAINTQSRTYGGEVVKYASYRICNIELCVKLLPGESVLNPKSEKLVINTLLIFYLMVMDEVLTIDSTRQKLNSLLERILMGRHSDESIVLNQLKGMSLHFPMPCTLMFLPRSESLSIQNDLQQYTHLSCVLGEYLILFLSPKMLHKKMEALREIAVKHNVVGIYSDTIDSMTEIPSTFVNLRESMDWLKRLKLSAGLYYHGDLFLKIGLLRLSEMEEAEKIVGRYWLPLKNGTARKSISIDRFASSLIDSNFNLAKAAGDLDVHYNTARNYYQEIERALGIDLEHADSRFILSMARQLHGLRAIPPAEDSANVLEFKADLLRN